MGSIKEKTKRIAVTGRKGEQRRREEKGEERRRGREEKEQSR